MVTLKAAPAVWGPAMASKTKWSGGVLSVNELLVRRMTEAADVATRARLTLPPEWLMVTLPV